MVCDARGGPVGKYFAAAAPFEAVGVKNGGGKVGLVNRGRGSRVVRCDFAARNDANLCESVKLILLHSALLNKLLQ